MPKYIICRKNQFGVKYLTKIINKRPYFSSDRSMAEACENRELAEFIAEQARNYSGNNWKVMEVENATD